MFLFLLFMCELLFVTFTFIEQDGVVHKQTGTRGELRIQQMSPGRIKHRYGCNVVRTLTFQC